MDSEPRRAHQRRRVHCNRNAGSASAISVKESRKHRTRHIHGQLPFLDSLRPVPRRQMGLPRPHRAARARKSRFPDLRHGRAALVLLSRRVGELQNLECKAIDARRRRKQPRRTAAACINFTYKYFL